MKNLALILLCLPAIALAQPTKSKAKTAETSTTTTTVPEEAPSEEDFRCERFMGRDLKVLKTKMVENCNLNKPFSSSLSVFTGEDTFLYCCHGK